MTKEEAADLLVLANTVLSEAEANGYYASANGDFTEEMSANSSAEQDRIEELTKRLRGWLEPIAAGE